MKKQILGNYTLKRLQSIALVWIISIVFMETSSYANQSCLSNDDYFLTVTAEMAVKDIKEFQNDLDQWIFPEFSDNSKRVFDVFGGEENSYKYFDYIAYIICMLDGVIPCMLNDVTPNIDCVLHVIDMCKPDGEEMGDITDIMKSIQANGEKSEFSDMKGFVDAVKRTHKFWMKHRKILPVIDCILEHGDDLLDPAKMLMKSLHTQEV